MGERARSVEDTEGLRPYLSPLAVWALSVGSAIGWGSLVVTSSSYLSQAGPAGSILGLMIGFAMMVIMCSHYHFLATRYPETGGLYSYVKHIFGYEVYLGEAILTLVVIALTATLCIMSRKATAHAMLACVLLFTAGITVCFVAAMAGHVSSGMTMAPVLIPDKSALQQVVHVAFLSPWAFIGFETVTHSVAEHRFKHSKLFRIMFVAVVVTTLLYLFVILMSVSAYPEGCTSWLDYITHLDQFEGIEGLPAFYAARHYLGDAGVCILMASLLALVFSSLIGMMRAVSRLCYAVAQDSILP